MLAIGYPLWDFDEFIYRAALPNLTDQILGALTILLVLEATRRTTGWILPVVALVFLAYAWLGPWLPPPWTHQGYGLDRIVGHMYMTLEGIFGVPLDVAATFIILFTIYGAVLEHSKAGEFYVNFSLAATGGKPTGAGRTVTLASFLLGGPSGSGVATTITLGSVAWPLLAKAVIRQRLRRWSSISRRDRCDHLTAGSWRCCFSDRGISSGVLPRGHRHGHHPDAALLLVSLHHGRASTRSKFGARPIAVAGESVWSLTRKYGYHFVSLVAIVVFMLWGYTATLAVVYAILLSIALSFIRRDTALTLPRLWQDPGRWGHRRSVSRRYLRHRRDNRRCRNASRASASKFSIIILNLAGSNLFLTVAYTAIAVWILGLAMPVTASYIRRGDHRPRDDQARHSSLCRAHVYLLLRCALRGLATDRARPLPPQRLPAAIRTRPQ